MKMKITYEQGGLHVFPTCDYCGKPITRSVQSGMTCEALCTDKWMRWDRLGRAGFQKYLGTLGKLEEALAEREALREHLFNEDGTPKFSGKGP